MFCDWRGIQGGTLEEEVYRPEEHVEGVNVRGLFL
jgi:hypothetical protein